MNYNLVKKALTDVRDRFIEHIIKKNLSFPINDLAGACGICSFLAFRMLRCMGLRPIFHMNNSHCFVTVDGYWVDLTLKQFAPDADEVFFYDHPYRMEKLRVGFVHRSARKATTERGIRRLFSGWPPEQNPFKQTIPKLPRLPKSNRLTKLKIEV